MTDSPHSVATPPPGEPSLDLPYYRAPFGAAVSRFFRKYAVFSGRAGRAEYWWWVLASALVTIIIQVINGVITGDWQQSDRLTVANVIQAIFSLATLIPSLALTWRRLHDTNRSGLWYFFGFVPLVGWIVLLVFTLQAARSEGQRFDRTIPHS